MDYEPLILVVYSYTMGILFTNMPIVLGGSWLAITRWKKSHAKRVNDIVWDILKKTHILEEHEAQDLNKDVFFTPLGSPGYLGPFNFEPTPNALHCQYTPFRSAKLLKLHENIVTELFDSTSFTSCLVHSSSKTLFTSWWRM